MKLQDANLQLFEKNLFHTSSLYFAFIFSECIKINKYFFQRGFEIMQAQFPSRNISGK